MNFFVLILLSAVWWFGESKLHHQPPVRVVPAVQFDKIEDTLIYEGTVPLTFKIQFPNLKGCNPHEDLKCKLFHAVLEEHGISEKYGKQKEVGPRKKRSLLLAGAMVGYLIRPAITKFTHNLFGTDDDSSRIEKLEQVQRKTTAELIKYSNSIQQEMNTHAHAIHGVEEGLKSTESSLRKLWDFVEALHYFNDVRLGLLSCKTKLLPTSVLPGYALSSKLDELQIELQRTNHTFAFDKKKFSILFKLPIADCFMQEDGITVIVNIPVIQAGKKYNLYELQHGKFGFQGSICEIYPSETTFVGHETTGDKFILITKHLLQHCLVHEHGLCLVPPFQKESQESLHCVAGILKKRSIDELRSMCGFRCHPDKGLSIEQVSSNALSIINAKKVELFCSDGKHTEVAVPETGALYVELMCRCHIYVDNILLPPMFPCGTVEDVSTRIIHFVPEMWTLGLDHMLTSRNAQFKSNASIVDFDWNTKIPVFNFTVLDSVNDSHFYYHYGATATAWLFLVFLLVLTCCICKRQKNAKFIVKKLKELQRRELRCTAQNCNCSMHKK